MSDHIPTLWRWIEFLLTAEESRLPYRNAPDAYSEGHRWREGVVGGIKLLFWMGLAAWIGGCLARLG